MGQFMRRLKSLNYSPKTAFINKNSYLSIMKFKYRIPIIITIALIVFFSGVFAESRMEQYLSPEIYKNPTISVQNFGDDFIRVTISCYWKDKPVNFIVLDQWGNLKHNSSFLLSCEGYKKINLQGEPQDYPMDRMYMVKMHFDNQTISTEYFNLSESTKKELIKREIFSFSYFMIYESRLARGSYSDDQRLLYVDTRDPVYAKNFIIANSLGVISTFTIFFIIDIGIWIGYWIYSGKKKERKFK